MLDLYHFSFNVIDQVHLPDLTGILVSPPPKKSSRGGRHAGASRENDLLVLFLSLTGKNSLKDEELNTLLERIAQTYYRSGGSLTAGMRAAAELCNAQLMERNLRSARDEGGQAIGRLNLAVLRDDTLFLAVAGPTHAFVLGADAVQDCYDPQSNRGLGAGASVSLRYFQARLQPGDVLVFAPEPPASWTAETFDRLPGPDARTPAPPPAQRDWPQFTGSRIQIPTGQRYGPCLAPSFHHCQHSHGLYPGFRDGCITLGTGRATWPNQRARAFASPAGSTARRSAGPSTHFHGAILS